MFNKSTLLCKDLVKQRLCLVFNSQTGQALLEITIASGLAVLVISAITVTTIVGLRNSQFAQHQVQATKFAQEGLELVRTIKNRNCPINASNGVAYYWTDNLSLIWGNQGDITIQNDIYMPALSPTCHLQSTTVPNTETLNTRFKRVIQLSPLVPVDNTKIKVTSIVTWTDYSGSHQSELVTVLAQ